MTLYRGKPCRHGHKNGLRYSTSRACRDCVISRARAMRRLATWLRRMERAREVDVDMNC
jgi:hypothetical protein